MKTPILSLMFAGALVGCIRSSNPPKAPIENDPSIVFPPFFAYPTNEVGAKAETYVLDGAVFQAIQIATNDFLPSSDKERPCWDRPESQRYRIIRQGDIIFVRIDDNPEACGMDYIALDTGARYAISVDGRILRRLIDGEPEGPLGPEMPEEDLTPPAAALDGGLPGSPDGG